MEPDNGLIALSGYDDNKLNYGKYNWEDYLNNFS